MADAIYFSKIEYREVIGYGNTSSIMLLNIPERELSYQVCDWKRRMPAIEGVQTERRGNHTWTYSITAPAKRIGNEKTGFEPQMIRDEPYESEIAFSYASEADLLNMALFGKTASQWRSENEIKGKAPNIRDFASAEELVVLINLEDTNADLIRQEVPQIERLKILREKAYRQLELLTKNQDTIEALKKNLIKDC